MQIIENAPNRLTLRNRSLLFGGVFAFGAMLWLVAVVGSSLNGAVEVLMRTPQPDMLGIRILGLGVMVVFGVFFAWLGIHTAINTFRGTTCTFDREAETVVIRKPDKLWIDQRQHSIYGISHTHMERNIEFKMIAVYLVLRNGERILLGVCHEHEVDDVKAILNTIKTFLYSH